MAQPVIKYTQLLRPSTLQILKDFIISALVQRYDSFAGPGKQVVSPRSQFLSWQTSPLCIVVGLHRMGLLPTGLPRLVQNIQRIDSFSEYVRSRPSKFPKRIYPKKSVYFVKLILRQIPVISKVYTILHNFIIYTKKYTVNKLKKSKKIQLINSWIFYTKITQKCDKKENLQQNTLCLEQ